MEAVLEAEAKVYLVTIIFVWLPPAVFYFSPIPEISGDDMQILRETIGRDDQKPFLKQYGLFLAVWAQFMYVGAQGYCHSIKADVRYQSRLSLSTEVAGYRDSKSSKLLSDGQGLFTLGRFFCTFRMEWIHARYILAAFVSMLVILSGLASGIGGTAGVGLYMALF